ncbi:hypothetical protein CTAYLR_008370 [Chrysophaeum taylorii]|uniref:Uncharacterized protein n=1 Tax=Chrysophaeum taylorii TaxID=2483200 RepID=A0AAD7UM86_9STRA|nr:hypothetical protein CTAYLR_008370 [Chrysophaeum taylorii]
MLGLDYTLNWSLNGDGVTPGGEAFRITKPAYAAKLLGGAPSALGAPTDPAGEVDEEAFDAAMQRSVEILEAAKVLYVTEGDAPGERVPCRIITDDLGLAATAMGQVVEQMPLREPKGLKITCFATPAGPDFAAFDLFEEKGEERAKIILSGADASASKVKASVQLAAAKLLEPPPPDSPAE